MKPLLAGIGAVLLAFGTHAAALDLGQIGPVYSIAEPHLLDVIHERLRAKERSGELQRWADAAAARAASAVRQPTPVAGLAATRLPRTFLVDPSFELDRNVVDGAGRLLFAAGTRKNPLEVVALTQPLLFFDARDPAQVAHARSELDGRRGRVKLILVAGSYLQLMTAWHTRVYYDQNGWLTRRLGITQVPALVTQEGLALRIDERMP
jgi:conjugal transfer pilus assembly protein TraW